MKAIVFHNQQVPGQTALDLLPGLSHLELSETPVPDLPNENLIPSPRFGGRRLVSTHTLMLPVGDKSNKKMYLRLLLPLLALRGSRQRVAATRNSG